jgi:hypothetical protein
MYTGGEYEGLEMAINDTATPEQTRFAFEAVGLVNFVFTKVVFAIRAFATRRFPFEKLEFLM